MYIIKMEIVKGTRTMNLADPELELIDPTPNIHSMFLHFDKTFFWAKLSSRCVVRWSKRMYSCAGITSYEGGGGLCDIALSEPLLKLRPRKDFIETLLHEMIHAYLFVTRQDQDRDGHGPNFRAHMHRINRAAGLNISIYHDFHDEVRLYQTHWWRCNGPCQKRRPHFGIIRRSNNRAPGPSECWWSSHQKYCGGTFIKIKEPPQPEKKSKKNNASKTNGDITKYINNNNKETSNKNIIQNKTPNKPILKDSSNIPVKPNLDIKKHNKNSTLVVNSKNINFKPETPKPKIPIFNGAGFTLNTSQTKNEKRPRTSSTGILEEVRNIWANKQIPTNNVKPLTKESTKSIKVNKHKAEEHSDSPPPKIKKIDDYFKTAAVSVLKNIYGQDFNITQSKSDEKFKATPIKTNLVDCPVCCRKIGSDEINRHLDECLNKGVIDNLTKSSNSIKQESEDSLNDKAKLEKLVGVGISNHESNEAGHNSKSKGDYYKSNGVTENQITNRNAIDLTKTEFVNDTNHKRTRVSFNIGDFKTIEPIVNGTEKKITNLRKSDSFKDLDSKKLQNTAINHTETVKLYPEVIEEPGCSKTDLTSKMACPCCGETLNTSVDEHLDECLSFFENNTTVPEEGASTSSTNETIVIDDGEDKFDESQTFNATGTKFPCPCCLKMVEEIDMNSHLDKCLG